MNLRVSKLGQRHSREVHNRRRQQTRGCCRELRRERIVALSKMVDPMFGVEPKQHVNT